MELISPMPEAPKKVQGRQISLGECKFIFNKIWKATVDCCEKHPEKEQEEDHLHLDLNK